MVFLLFGVWQFAVPSSAQPLLARPVGDLTPDQLSWGETQLRQMLKDRPRMAPYLREGDPLWEWTLRQFAGENVPGGILWDARDPSPLWDASSMRPWNGERAWVRNSDRRFIDPKRYGDLKSGTFLWHCLIFELSNLKLGQKYGEIDKKAYMGEVGREEYAFRKYYIERMYAGGETAKVWEGIWIPNCEKAGQPLSEARFLRNEWDLRDGRGVRAFIEKYFFVVYGKGKKMPGLSDTFISSILRHYDLHTANYDGVYVPWMIKTHQPPPAPETVDILWEKVVRELVPPGSAR